MSKCSPVETNRDMLADRADWDLWENYPDALKTLDKIDDPAWPCGFIAKFHFNDQFAFIKSEDRSFSAKIDDTDIAHSIDKEKRFIANDDMKEKGAYWTDIESEHLMVWYQMESLRDFVKLYGRLDGPLVKGKKYVLALYDNWASDKLENEKHIVFSEVGTFGGKNYVLSYFFAGAAAITLLVLLFFMIGFFAFVKGRRIEEESYIQKLKY